MLVVPRHRRDPIRQPNRTANALIGRPLHETLGNRGGSTGRQGKMPMIESIARWLNRPAAAAADLLARRRQARRRARHGAGPPHRQEQSIRSATPAPVSEIQEKKTLP
jgi:hypothetical protein